jgi:hypothetical protein
VDEETFEKEEEIDETGFPSRRTKKKKKKEYKKERSN